VSIDDVVRSLKYLIRRFLPEGPNLTITTAHQRRTHVGRRSTTSIHTLKLRSPSREQGWYDARSPLTNYSHSTLSLKKVNTLALVYHWAGSNPSLKPLFLAAHQGTRTVTSQNSAHALMSCQTLFPSCPTPSISGSKNPTLGCTRTAGFGVVAVMMTRAGSSVS
jgi:hypothetical protein